MLKVAFFDAKEYDKTYFLPKGEEKGISFSFFETRLSEETVSLAAGFDAVCTFVSDEITPLEAGLGMFAKIKDKADFIGRDALVAQKEVGLARRSVGIELQDKAIPRAGYPVEVDGVQVGIVTTGYRSISTDRSVCVALVDKAYTEMGTLVQIRIRKKVFPGIVTKRRFYETNYRK